MFTDSSLSSVPARGPSLPKCVHEICKSIGFVDLDIGFVDLIVGFVDVIIGFLGVAIEFLVDLYFSVGFALDLVDLALDLDLENVIRDLEECRTRRVRPLHVQN